MFFKSDNPVRDAESYQYEQEHQPYIHCEMCGEKVYIESDTHYAEKFYSIDGTLMCEDCANYWLEQQRVASCS